MKSTKSHDRFDFRLLTLLQQRGRATIAELSRATNLSESSCLRRVRQLEAEGVIQGYAAIVAQERVGLSLNVFVTITLTSQSDAALKEFEQAVGEIEEVMECFLMTGTADYLIRLTARDVNDLEQLHAKKLTRLPNVARVTSSIAMRKVVRRMDLPIRDIT